MDLSFCVFYLCWYETSAGNGFSSASLDIPGTAGIGHRAHRITWWASRYWEGAVCQGAKNEKREAKDSLHAGCFLLVFSLFPGLEGSYLGLTWVLLCLCVAGLV